MVLPNLYVKGNAFNKNHLSNSHFQIKLSPNYSKLQTPLKTKNVWMKKLNKKTKNVHSCPTYKLGVFLENSQ